MSNRHAARALKQVADLIELTGGNAFRARAYAQAARVLDGLDEPLEALVADGRLRTLPGIGAGIAAELEAFVRTGALERLDELLAAVPPGLLDVLRVKGLGPRKARTLWQDLGVTSLDELEAAALAGRIAALPGFGRKTEAALLEGARRLRTYLGRWHYAAAVHAVAPVLEALRHAPDVARAEPCGALRRRCETVEAAELLVQGDAEAVRDVLIAHAVPAESPPDDTLFAGTLPDGLPLRVYDAGEGSFAPIWWRRTGSPEHVAAFTARYGEPEGDAETDLYARAGLAFVPPELREGGAILEEAARGPLPRLVEEADLRGSLHNHTTASDGAHSLREMALAARRMGYAYFAVCDHSRSLAVANGLSIERLRAQGREVRALQAELDADGGPPLRLLHGTEVDILADGSLDYPDEVLAELDLVVASVHTHFGMSRTEATERIVRAVSHPLTDILGHPTGRLLLRREGYPLDVDAVLEACAAHGVAVELNANPYRLDLDWRHLRRARELGVLVAINPDAHAVEGLADVRWGVAVARKGGLTPEGCLNALDAEAFLAWLAARRARTGIGRTT